jgi:molybdopterin biosynthesis enzyme
VLHTRVVGRVRITSIGAVMMVDAPILVMLPGLPLAPAVTILVPVKPMPLHCW